MNVFVTFISAVTSYLIGAAPFGLLISRSRGVDIRTVGSGNIGATNVFRSLGRKWGILTFICDVLKGFFPAFVLPSTAYHLVQISPSTVNVLPLICAISAVAGHNWPVYLGFKGGKGVATTTGALLGIAPLPLAAGLVTWIIVFLVSRYVSAASISAALSVPAAAWFLSLQTRYPSFQKGTLLPAFLTFLGALAVWRHKANIVRLARGTEHRFDFKKKNRQRPDTGAKPGENKPA